MRGVAALLAAGSLLLLTACAQVPKPQPPKVGLADIVLLDGNLLQQRLRIDLDVANPNDFDIPLDGLTFRLEVNDRLLAEGLSDDRVTIPRFGEARVSVLATTSIFDIMQQVLALQDGNRLSYRLAGEAYVSGFLIRRLPFEKSGELELEAVEGGQKSLIPR